MDNEILLAAGLACLMVVGVGTACRADGPEYTGFYTPERVANLRANVDRYDWAAAQRDAAVKRAEGWVAYSDDELWSMVPGQKLPRTIDPQMQWGKRIGGCPLCGGDVYRHSKYPWRVNIPQQPWKVICPDCKGTLPANDFEAYYRSGIDETGCFNPDSADRSLLFNAEHPGADDPKHEFAVDDGWGFKTPDGAVNRFIGYYGYALWGYIKNGAAALADAYLYTGQAIYAHKCGVLLDRIADVYPAMDWAEYGGQGWFHSGSTDGGKIEGSIWEVSTVIKLCDAYGKIRPGLYEQPELLAFLAEKARQFELPGQKGTYGALVSNIENNLIGEFVKAVKSGRKIYGNEGGPQHCVARCAVTLDREPTTSQWLDWLFEEGTIGQGALKPGEGGHIPGLIVATIDRDGAGAEGAPGYSLSWGAALGAAADLLRDYGKYDAHDVYRDFPQFKRTITAGWRLGVLASYTPNIGDSGACGSRGGIIAASPGFIVRGYKYLGDPRIGITAVWANDGKTEGLGRDIYAQDPYAVENSLAKLVEDCGPEPSIEGRNNAGYGLASVEFGPRHTGHALWMYYGLNAVAGHKSALMCGYDAFGFTVLPPPGYRELWGGWPKSVEFESNTIAHNTVVVNRLPQSTVRVGRPELFAQLPDFGAFCVDSPDVYPGVTEVYRRSMVLMKLGDRDSYALDVFHILGGSEHLYSFHALPGPVGVEGLQLTPQAGGSYAGEDVPFKTSIKGAGMGFSWLDKVQRDAAPPEAFRLDFMAAPPYWGLTQADDLHLRYHGLTRYTEVALADGYPPSNQSAGAPEKLRYLLARNSGSDDLATTCVGVIEPFKGKPLIDRVRRLDVEPVGPGPQPVAVEVALSNGAVDYLMCGPDDDTQYVVEGGLSFRGRIAALRVEGGRVTRAWLVRAASVSRGDFSVSLPGCGYRGVVAKMDRDMTGHGYIWVDTELPIGDTLKGSEIIIDNDRSRNACYTIEGVQRDEGLSRIDCGEMCFIRGFNDITDYEKGYQYNFKEKASWIIPHRARLAWRDEHAFEIEANVPVRLVKPQ